MKKSKQGIDFLSVVMPAYKSEKFVVASLDALNSALLQTGYRYEIILVVDGTEIDNAFTIAKNFINKHQNIKVLGYPKNMGKGHAVRFGMAQAKGDVVGYIDCGDEINLEGLPLLLEHLKWYRADGVVASKRHPASKVKYPWQRRILSFFYQILVRVLFGVKVRDTQVGMKFFKRELLEKVMPRLMVKAYAFDIELLAVSRYLDFKEIYEAPVEIKMKFDAGISTIASKGFIKTIFNMVWDTFAVFYRLRILRYYDDSNKKNWTTPSYLTLPTTQ